MKMQKKRYVLKFPAQSGDMPLSYHLVKDFDIRINILRAEVWPGKTGSLVLELEGTSENLKSGIAYLKENQVTCEPLNKKITWNEKRCISCGNYGCLFCRCFVDGSGKVGTAIRFGKVHRLRALCSSLPAEFV